MTQWLEDPAVAVSLNTEDNAEISVTFVYEAIRTRDSNVREIQTAPPLRSTNKRLYSVKI
jgi:hypothetical protein